MTHMSLEQMDAIADAVDRITPEEMMHGVESAISMADMPDMLQGPLAGQDMSILRDDEYSMKKDEYIRYLHAHTRVDTQNAEDLYRLMALKLVQMGVLRQEFNVLLDILNDVFAAEDAEYEQALSESPLLQAVPSKQARILYEFGLIAKDDFEKATEQDVLALDGVGKTTVEKLKKAGVHFSDTSRLEHNTWDIKVTYEEDEIREFMRVHQKSPAPASTSAVRVLRVPKSLTLEELASEILFAFNFVDDQPHAFFMDTEDPEKGPVYYSKDAEREEDFAQQGKSARKKSGKKSRKQKKANPTSADITLETLRVKQKFTLLFDFEDEWIFDVVVRRSQYSGRKPDVELISSLGDAPVQYPEYDDTLLDELFDENE
ncbi:IS1096 element passenger TnpR family protein [Alloscardovia macacae]|uniref:Plasmid pRiA4b Orf3-like domain-containing protein n=1 Tax=Alloscardovia macacae TaxID=1160091 RepID=A0A261F5G3_9BIFI|nr:hypothetical protein [Alloscardovia macacae]OZG54387.1 hypothetical protein ALMA_0848 [Alloscardovia macacae]